MQAPASPRRDAGSNQRSPNDDNDSDNPAIDPNHIGLTKQVLVGPPRQNKRFRNEPLGHIDESDDIPDTDTEQSPFRKRINFSDLSEKSQKIIKDMTL